MDILDIFLDILLKLPQPLMGLFLYYWFSIPHCCLQGGLPLCRCIIQETTIYYILISVQNKTALQSDVS